MPIDTVKTGAAISAHRQRMNLSQQGLAGLMNVTHQAVSKWEKGLALPDTEILLALARLFGTSMENLLTGVYEPESETVSAKEAPAEEAPAEEAPSSIPAEELNSLDLSAVMNMLPFVSTATADHLFRSFAQANPLDAGALLALAPFVSKKVLAGHISTHLIQPDSPEVAASLAPFLPTDAVDELVLGMQDPLPQHAVQMLMPFVSTRVADQLARRMLAAPAEASTERKADLSKQIQDKILQKFMRRSVAQETEKSSQKRESPRAKLVRKAAESGRYDLLEDCFDDMDPETCRMLLQQLFETGDAKLLELFCENAGELAPDAQLELVQLLAEGKLYGNLAEVIEEVDEEVQHKLLDQAFENGDPELLHILSEHL